MDKVDKIMKILSATLEFQAVFIDAEGEMIKKPVICWAVLESKQNRFDVKGMCDGDDGITLCDDNTFCDHIFVGYIGPGEDLLSLMPKAEEMRQDLLDEEEIIGSGNVFESEGVNQEFLAEDQEYLKQDEFMKNLPLALSQLSVLVREQIDGGYAPKEWEQWMDMMLKFGQLIEDSKGKKGKSSR